MKKVVKIQENLKDNVLHFTTNFYNCIEYVVEFFKDLYAIKKFLF